MRPPLLTASLLAVALLGCFAACEARIEPGVVTADVAPAYVDEGAPYNGVVVSPYPATEYVYSNGGYYYYHPTYHHWVRAPQNFHPAPTAHVYQHWSQHPQYHQENHH